MDAATRAGWLPACCVLPLVERRCSLARPRDSCGRARPQKIKQEYDTDTESTFINADEVADKKSIYVTIVGGLIVVAFVAPMLQFFYYTGGD